MYKRGLLESVTLKYPSIFTWRRATGVLPLCLIPQPLLPWILVKIQMNEGRRKTKRRTRGRKGKWLWAPGGERERKRKRTVRGGVRKEIGPSGEYRENVRKMSQLVELGKI